MSKELNGTRKNEAERPKALNNKKDGDYFPIKVKSLNQ